jgi:hypothetical protein
MALISERLVDPSCLAQRSRGLGDEFPVGFQHRPRPLLRDEEGVVGATVQAQPVEAPRLAPRAVEIGRVVVGALVQNLEQVARAVDALRDGPGQRHRQVAPGRRALGLRVARPRLEPHGGRVPNVEQLRALDLVAAQPRDRRR